MANSKNILIDTNGCCPVPCLSVLLFDTVSLCNFLEKSQTKLFSMEKDFTSHFDSYSSNFPFHDLFKSCEQFFVFEEDLNN